jgi:hypothetical protein
VIDQDEIGFLDEGEGIAKRVHPEAIRVNGVSQRDVTSDTFIEAVLAEDSECRGETSLEIFALLVLVGEFRWPGCKISGCCLISCSSGWNLTSGTLPSCLARS